MNLKGLKGMIGLSELTHFNEQGRAKMVDVSEKSETVRTAIAKSSIVVNETIHAQITEGTNKKGDVFAVAQVAAIMAAKSTSTLIPMCHPIPLTGVDIQFEWIIDESTSHYEVTIQAFVKTKGVTGVEMEALTAASVAVLTIYDMCKAAGKEMVIGPTMLFNKTGGKNGDYTRKT
jgi:cyclic pyranopterin phosphate synthase